VRRDAPCPAGNAPHAARPARRNASRRPHDDWHDLDEPPRDLAAEAEHYAALYPQRARQIRRLGRLPKPCSFGPPEKDIVRAIVTGTGPNLRALDAPEPLTAAGD
jgi:hypothetical protein